MAAKATQDTTETQRKPQPGEKVVFNEESLLDGTVGAAIGNARTMLTAKRKIQQDLQAARDWLGQSVTLGVVNEEQARWIEEHLPKRTRGEE